MRLINVDVLRMDIIHSMGYYDDILEILERQPTVEPPTGKWEDTDVFYIGDDLEDSNVIDSWQSARCSNCNTYHTTPYMYYFQKYEFCPHCGARMQK